MALLKKALRNMAENCGCGDDENSGTALMSFLVRRNQAEEEETAHKSKLMKMVGDDDELELGDETDTVDMDTDDPEAGDMDMDPDAEMGDDREMDMDMDPDAEMDMDPDAEMDGEREMEPGDEVRGDLDMAGDDQYSDDDIEQEDDDEKRLGMIQSLLSMKR